MSHYNVNGSVANIDQYLVRWVVKTINSKIRHRHTSVDSEY